MTEVQMSKFSETILLQKYSHTKPDGTKENWDNVAYRVSKNVLKAVHAPKDQIVRTHEIIRDRKFIPGGRYLYATGRQYHQVNNCFLFRAEDSREGWADLLHKATLALMSGGGIGCDYSDIRPEGKLIRKTGGTATGPLALMAMTNEAGRFIMQGGSRRSAIWAGLKWSHADIQKFITLKNWIPEVRALKAQDFNFPATLDGTNISVLLDDEFFEAYGDEKNALHSQAQSVYWTTVRQMLKTGEPGFSIDTGKNSNETLRNAPICAETHVLTSEGYLPVSLLIGDKYTVWTGKRWAKNVVFRETDSNAEIIRVTMTGGREIRCDKTHPFLVEKYAGKGKNRKRISIDRIPAKDLKSGQILHVSLPEVNCTDQKDMDVNLYTLGYIYGDGSFGARNSEITFCTEESKECAYFIKDSAFISSVNWKDRRGYVRAYFKCDKYWEDRRKDIFPVEIYECSPYKAASFLAGLFDADGNWEEGQKRIRMASVHEDFLRCVSRLLEQHGILSGVSKAGSSTYGQSQGYQLVVMAEYNKKFADFVPCIRLQIELEGYESYRQSVIKVLSVEEDGYAPVYCADVKVAEHSFQAEGVIISNCTEVCSADDSDVCNLGSINMARIENLAEMDEIVDLAVAFLLAGTVYSDVPFAKIDQVRSKNRRLGLGLMGLHEWLLKHGKQYGPDDELGEYLAIYAKSTAKVKPYAKKWDLSMPIKTRAVAPTGTIGILAESSTGAEPLFCAAYKRRYLKGNIWNYQYVVDPVAKNLMDLGIPAEKIEDAYSLAEDVERRVSFQAWLQKYVDHSISSTVNLPAWGSEINNDNTVRHFGDIFIKHLPNLRGLTVYPDGARGGQPLTPVDITTALKHTGEVFFESADVCDITKGESCGS